MLQCLDFKNIIKMYEDDLPSSVSFETELNLWQHKWKISEKENALSLDTPEKVLPYAAQYSSFN